MKLLLFFGGWVIYDSAFIMLASEAFWSNFGVNITAIGTVLVLLITTWAGLQASRAKKIAEESKAVLEQLHTTTNSKMDALLEAKDALAKGLEDNVKLKAIEEAAYNKGKLEAIEKLKTEDALRKTPPEK